MDKLRSMEVFAAAAEAGSFSACADALGLSAVMVGKHVGQLERHLGVRLLQRSTRRQSLTEAGRLFLEECRQILERVRNAETVAERLHSQPRGRLRVTAPVTLGETAVAEAVSAYLLRYPEVTVELVLDDAFTDLIADGFDAAVRIGALANSDHLVARPLRPYRMAICAAPAYLAQAGHPRTLADLAGHRCLNHLLWPQGMGWPATADDQAAVPSAPLAANNGQALRRAALAGCGVVMQPEVLLAADIAGGLLVPLLEDAVPAPRPVHLLYPRDPRPLPKQASFVQIMLEKMGA
ncbi:LysR family transcriptional regulator [Cupriavidus basilensis OR16]|uniref:LysR family transcriptional regulator n=1 Tax=Cupriavidus basilensis OR16 TaxID=1127483 RepID=H1RZ85_9BURK|nr:LysR family transcriptional regulator [Cupriavidus basilensis]EHP44458.1 LysR family transcriptional regulator [Cupriavidus basilensis OR16]